MERLKKLLLIVDKIPDMLVKLFENILKIILSIIVFIFTVDEFIKIIFSVHIKDIMKHIFSK